MVNIKFSLIYKLLFSVAIFLGILSRAGIFTPNLQLHTLYSFTTISNACVMATMLFAAYKYKGQRIKVSLRFAQLNYLCVVMILITGVVYHFVLLPEKIAENPTYQVFTFGNIIAHYIAPAGMVIDWLLFEEKGLIKKREPLICISVPMLYFIVTSIYGYFGPTIPGKETSYIYFFMDVEKLGAFGVAKWVFAILIFVFCLAYSIYALDHTLSKRARTKRGENF